jgi:hypothetical protein
VALAGFTFPHLTAADPDDQAEGKLDPLGLAGIADQLADRIAPDVTARMARIRFLTAMAVGAIATERLAEEVGVDGRTTPELAFEWHVLEAFARDRELSPGATDRVPGIDKARTAYASGRRLDPNGYLKTPRVFGFNGVYKRLARGVGIVHDDLTPAERGFELTLAWERRYGLRGFADRLPRSPGGLLASDLESAVAAALARGRTTAQPRKFRTLSALLRPDDARGGERRLLWQWLLDPEQPVRTEYASRLTEVPDGSERDALLALAAIRPRISAKLRARLRAIASYERVAALLTAVFDSLRWESYRRGSALTPLGEASQNDLVRSASATLPAAMADAEEALDRIGLGLELQARLGLFAEPLGPDDLVRTCLDHHAAIQRAKPPRGKRPWFDDAPDGFFVRLGYELPDEPELATEYLHPYRVGAVRSFIRDAA